MPGNNEKGSSNVFVGAVFTLTTTLLLGGYVYTWSETGRQDDEKKVWRNEHNRLLDNRLDEMKKKQDKLEALVIDNGVVVKDLMKQLLEEQKKANEITKRRLEGRSQ